MKQGCSYSPWLFNRAIHHAVRLVAAALPHLDLVNPNTTLLPLLLAFEDDIIIIAEDAATIDPILHNLIAALATVSLHLNMTKCFLVIRRHRQDQEPLPRMVPIGTFEF